MFIIKSIAKALGITSLKTKIDNIDKKIKDFSYPRDGKLSDLELQKNRFEDLLALRALSKRFREQDFYPNEYFKSISENKKILTNCLTNDLDGGVNEFLKIIFKSSNISQRNTENSELNLITVMRPNEVQFWKCLNRALALDQRLFFSETSFFAGYASYFDKDVHPAYRKSLGFIIDDMGYYFDSRIESRLEKHLSESATLNEKDEARVNQIISFIINNNITKYNKYYNNKVFGIPDESVIVIDQKRNDASITLGQASNSNFDIMLEAAVRENPNKKIYIKRHPDNLFEKSKDEFKDKIEILPADVSVMQCLKSVSKVYTVTSQVGFEALLRGKEVITFGAPFYAGWGLTDDRIVIPRRNKKLTIQQLFKTACIDMSVYVNPDSSTITTIEETLERILWMRTKEIK